MKKEQRAFPGLDDLMEFTPLEPDPFEFLMRLVRLYLLQGLHFKSIRHLGGPHTRRMKHQLDRLEKMLMDCVFGEDANGQQK